MWLCGDIGGTHARLAPFDSGALGEVRKYVSGDHRDATALVVTWMRETGLRPTAACLGIAGPVIGNQCVATNLPWDLDGALLSEALGFPVLLINDFHAAARGVSRLGESDRVQVGGGLPVMGAPVGVIGAGTGLGQAIVVGGSVVAGEGGHAEFGAGTVREAALAVWLMERHGRASWEHVLSGPGLVRLARFTLEEGGLEVPAWLDHPNAPQRVMETMPDVVEWFAELYGAEAGNLALRSLAHGGVYVCGGIAPRMLPTLLAGGFRRRFEAKGKVGAAIAAVPVFVVTHPALGLLGAAEDLSLLAER